jgi:hypothetical protein
MIVVDGAAPSGRAVCRSTPYVCQHDHHTEEHEWGDDASSNKEFPEFSFHEYSSPI